MSDKSRFDPFKELSKIGDQVSKAIEDTFTSGSSTASLQIDIIETDDSIILVTGALLGLDTESLDISIQENNQVSITGKTVPPEEFANASYLKRERKFGTFARTVSIPVDIIADEAQAKFKDNMLTLTIPKAEKGPKVIRVTPIE